MGNCCDQTQNELVSSSGVLLKKGKVVVGIHNYRSSDLEDLSFNKGDRMKVIEPIKYDEKWIKVKHITRKQEGLVPANFVALENSLESQDWYFGNITRKDADRLILGDENQPIGTFLIRESEQNTGYSLSIKDCDEHRDVHVKHYKIEQLDDNGKFYTAGMSFKNLFDLVSAFSRHPYTLCCVLSNPCKKPEPTRLDISSKYKDEWEIDRSEIQVIKKLGKGNFGEVYYGKWNGQYDVAIKTLKEVNSKNTQEFLREAAIMKTFVHNRLVQLYGVCTLEEPMFIVQEYMCKGSVEHYLRKDKGKNIKFEDLIYIAYQVACGMEHLELLHCIHRDLAARNVLLGANNEVKVCDFGLARIMDQKEYWSSTVKFPIKWTAPEALTKKIFTTKSDVWSFGILLMELFTYGETPYNDTPPLIVMGMVIGQYHSLSITGLAGSKCASPKNVNKFVVVSDGRRMAKPKNYLLPDEIYKDVMLKCWDAVPQNRPSFKNLARYFKNMEVTYVSRGNTTNVIISHNAPKSYEEHNLRKSKKH